MMRYLLTAAAILLASGCERSAVDPGGNDPARQVIQVVILEGFGSLEPVVNTLRMVRLPGYYDLSAYDSVRISFTAERMTPGATVDHILVKVGPMCYKSDSLAVPRKDFAITVMRRDLSKPAMCAFSFLSPDPGATLLLSQLKVVGWAAY
jgi:hypothetical protein